MSYSLHIGDCLDVLPTLPAGSADCVVTSPPYWGLRDYGLAPRDWLAVEFVPVAGLPPYTAPAQSACLGLERDPWSYVGHMVAVFREVRRVLKADGTVWLNLGDCYATGAGQVGACPGGGGQGERWAGRTHEAVSRGALRDGRHAGKHLGMSALGPMTQPNRLPLPGLKPKDLVGIPHRVAMALEADGWYFRADVVWHKPAPMPSSVRDRPTVAHEAVFLLAASERYWYDADAVAEPCVHGDVSGDGPEYAPPGGGPSHKGLRRRSGNKARVLGDDRGRPGSHLGSGIPWEDATGTRNRRSVWTIANEPYPGAHFATMPSALAEVCIRAGCPGGGARVGPLRRRRHDALHRGAARTGLRRDRGQPGQRDVDPRPADRGTQGRAASPGRGGRGTAVTTTDPRLAAYRRYVTATRRLAAARIEWRNA